MIDSLFAWLPWVISGALVAAVVIICFACLLASRRADDLADDLRGSDRDVWQ